MNRTQEIILGIFKIVAGIFDANDISYYAAGGTCIGAIRHKGFIPWDDDLDIAVPIEYWDKITEILKKELPANLYLYTPDNVRHYHYTWIKVCDKNTSFIEKPEHNYKDSWKGIFIDIVPLSGLPVNERERTLYLRKASSLANLNNYLRFPDDNDTLKAFIGRLPFRILSKILPYNYYSKKYINLLKRFPLSEMKENGIIWHSQWAPRYRFPAKIFGKGEKVKFENSFMSVPSDYDSFLSIQYGDYMVLPPEDQRRTHNAFIDPEKPYTYYQVNGLKKE